MKNLWTTRESKNRLKVNVSHYMALGRLEEGVLVHPPDPFTPYISALYLPPQKTKHGMCRYGHLKVYVWGKCIELPASMFICGRGHVLYI